MNTSRLELRADAILCRIYRHAGFVFEIVDPPLLPRFHDDANSCLPQPVRQCVHSGRLRILIPDFGFTLSSAPNQQQRRYGSGSSE